MASRMIVENLPSTCICCSLQVGVQIYLVFMFLWYSLVGVGVFPWPVGVVGGIGFLAWESKARVDMYYDFKFSCKAVYHIAQRTPQQIPIEKCKENAPDNCDLWSGCPIADFSLKDDSGALDEFCGMLPGKLSQYVMLTNITTLRDYWALKAAPETNPFPLGRPGGEHILWTIGYKKDVWKTELKQISSWCYDYGLNGRHSTDIVYPIMMRMRFRERYHEHKLEMDSAENIWSSFRIFRGYFDSVMCLIGLSLGSLASVSAFNCPGCKCPSTPVSKLGLQCAVRFWLFPLVALLLGFMMSRIVFYFDTYLTSSTYYCLVQIIVICFVAIPPYVFLLAFIRTVECKSGDALVGEASEVRETQLAELNCHDAGETPKHAW